MAPPQRIDTDWAYAAGFVDGEGCITVARSAAPRRGRYYYRVYVDVANRDRDVLEWMRLQWGGWVVGVRRPASVAAQPIWTWRCPTGVAAKPFLIGIRSWLRIKSKQCDNALAMIDLVQRRRHPLRSAPLDDALSREQEAVYWVQRKLNHRGKASFVRPTAPRDAMRSLTLDIVTIS